MAKVNYRRSNRKFINPYTFVPTPANKHVSRSEAGPFDAADLHTGILRCRLYVRTPLGIPDAEKVKEEGEHKTYPFFSCQEDKKQVLMIPGSSLRGPIRSVFEAATDSCFSTLRENTGLSKRVENRDAYQAGVLKWTKGGWKLYEADRYLLPVDPNPMGERRGFVDRNYRKYMDLPGDVYVNICKGKDGYRFARTQKGEELRFGDMVEFTAYTEGKGTYKKNGNLIWKGAARNVKKSIPGSEAVSGKERGLIYIGENFVRKHGESIFVPKCEVKGLSQEQLEKAYRGLLETLEIYRDPAINRSQGRGHSGYADFEHGKREMGIPVWYSKKDEKLSLASIGRTFYRSTLNDLAGERRPCTNRGKLCEACMLFGMAGEESLGSRIRITDARALSDYEHEPVTLQILGQPRYSYLPFYARKAGGVPTTYDEKGVEIAGRKFYWHNERVAVDPTVYTEKKANDTNRKMSNTLELVMPGAEFQFDIYYDGITEEQLHKLMWCLHFGENEKEGAFCHKIGHGKPLGLGSVKIVIEERAERTFGNGMYEWKKEKPVKAGPEPKIVNREALRKVMDFRWLAKGPNKDIPIMYPEVYDEHGKEFKKQQGNEGARHIWYMKNKEKPCDNNHHDRIETLSDILAERQTLTAYQVDNR